MRFLWRCIRSPIEILRGEAHLSDRQEFLMLDIALVITGTAFFVICELYTRLCEHL